jgi:hypothetical protein
MLDLMVNSTSLYCYNLLLLLLFSPILLSHSGIIILGYYHTQFWEVTLESDYYVITIMDSS